MIKIKNYGQLAKKWTSVYQERINGGASSLADFVKEQGQMQSVLYVQFAKYCAEVRLDSTFGYIQFACNDLVVTAKMYHLCNLQFSGCQMCHLFSAGVAKL